MQYFAIIGAQRSGTTWLYNMLNEHPEVYMASTEKSELKFFMDDAEYKKGKEYYLDRYFSNIDAHIIGEKSTSYMEYPIVSGRIKAFFPDAKLISILRDPVKRAISNYAFSVKNKLETRSIEEAFLYKKPTPINFNTSVDPYNYLGRGEYQRQLKPFIDCVGKENMKMIVYEKLQAFPDTLSEVYDFLGCSKSIVPTSINKIVNALGEDIVVPAEVMEYLKSYYVNYNKELGDIVDTSWWS